MTFWIVTSFMAAAMSLLFALVLIRARNAGEPAAAYDLKVYRQQLRDIDKDLARGVINEADAERTRTEISRRILAADAQMQSHRGGTGQPMGLSYAASGLVALALVAGSVFLYRDLGAPGYTDLPLDFRKQMAELRAESRPSQAEAEAQIPAAPAPEAEASYLELVAQLRATAAKRENDAQGQALLAQHEANLGNFKAAYEAKQRYIDIMAGDLGPQDFSELSELMIMAAGGYVSPEAEEALEQALTLDGRHGPSLYYMGLTLRQIGRPDVAFAVWKDAYERGPAEAPWVKAIGPQLEDLAYQAGVKYQLPAPQSLPASAAPGPSAEDVQAAQEMSEGDRQEMIRGMVNGLSQRLAEEGGTPEEWARLIGALGVLGEGARAEAIYTEAGQKFAGNEAALALLAQAAQQAGIAQ